MISFSPQAAKQLAQLRDHYEALDRLEAVRNLVVAVQQASNAIERDPTGGLSAPRPYPQLAKPLSQEGMGKIIGVQRLQVTRMEANRKKPITPSADRAIRMFFALQQHDRDLADRILELLNEFDDQEHKRMTFIPSDHGWMRAA